MQAISDMQALSDMQAHADLQALTDAHTHIHVMLVCMTHAAGDRWCVRQMLLATRVLIAQMCTLPRQAEC